GSIGSASAPPGRRNIRRQRAGGRRRVNHRMTARLNTGRSGANGSASQSDAAEAQAAIRAADGRRAQAGLWPNPVVGYTGEEFAARAFGDKSEHFAFAEQTILLGGKLGKSQRIFDQEKVLAEQEAIA